MGNDETNSTADEPIKVPPRQIELAKLMDLARGPLEIAQGRTLGEWDDIHHHPETNEEAAARRRYRDGHAAAAISAA